MPDDSQIEISTLRELGLFSMIPIIVLTSFNYTTFDHNSVTIILFNELKAISSVYLLITGNITSVYRMSKIVM